MFNNYNVGTLRDIDKIIADDESYIYAYKPEIHSNRLYGCFKMNETQQKLLAVEELWNNDTPFFFFGKISYVATAPLYECKTIHSEWCTTVSFQQIFGEVWKYGKRSRVIHHHVNASS